MPTRGMFLALLALATLITTALLYGLGHEHSVTSTPPHSGTSVAQTTWSRQLSRSNNTGAHNNASPTRGYDLAVKIFKKILREAQNIYREALEENKTYQVLIYEPYSSLAKSLLLGATIRNNTVLSINNTLYKYVVIRAYDAGSQLSFTPHRVRVGDIVIEMLPRNRSVTYTGAIPYSYLVHYQDATCKAGFASIGFVEASYNLTIRVNRVCDDVYTVSISIVNQQGSTKNVSKVWAILVRGHS